MNEDEDDLAVARAEDGGTMPGDGLLSLEDATRVLGVSKPTLYRLLAQGALPGRKVGKQWRFRRSDLAAYLDRGGAPAALPTVPAALLDAERSFFDGELNRLGAAAGEPADDEGEEEDAAPLTGLFDRIARYAVATGASDIHLEPLPGGAMRLRLRNDGLLRTLREPMAAPLRAGLVAAAKARAHILTEDAGAPQEGRARYRFGGRDFELRVSAVPVAGAGPGAESVVARVIDRSQTLVGLDRLGLDDADRTLLQGWLRQPSGLVVLAGPAGSGKTALLSSLLSAVESPENKKIVTVEDPVEMRLPFATRVAVRGRAGLPAGSALRAAARQDPDIVACDAGRLGAPAVAALAELALTGHLVLAAVPGPRRAAEAPAWLLEGGLAPFQASAVLVGVAGVRLVRRVCESCRTAYTATARELHPFRMSQGVPDTGAPFYRGAGCAQCRGTGYRGRIGLFELMPFSPALAEALVARAAGPEEVEEAAVAGGMTTLFGDGLRKAIAGLTTLEEVMRAVVVSI